MDTTTQIFDAIRDYESQRDTRRVFPTQATIDQLATLPQALPANGLAPAEILNLLIETVAPATVLTTSGRYFGFVTGGALPAAQAANMLATAWDQNTALTVMSPAGTNIEQVALNWLAQLLHIPSTAAGAFVT
ncbi:MAG: pyridoxal-dependent decarboxylase, partial [Acidobacteria bacterium]|nr:pyridoxal-dependent decarboxylase [Acidobacteriota bacterium]